MKVRTLVILIASLITIFTFMTDYKSLRNLYHEKTDTPKNEQVIGILESEERVVSDTQTITGFLIDAVYGNRNGGFTIKTDSGEEKHLTVVFAEGHENIPFEADMGKRFQIQFNEVTYKRGGEILGTFNSIVQIKPLSLQ